MSKIGKKPITIPKDVQVKMDNGFVLVKGPKGELKRFIPGSVDLNIEGDVFTSNNCQRVDFATLIKESDVVTKDPETKTLLTTLAGASFNALYHKTT